MIDLNTIKEKYASMPDSELELFARTESKQLTQEGLVLLKEELRNRKLAYDIEPEDTVIKQEDLNSPGNILNQHISDILELREQEKQNSEILHYLIEAGVEESQVPGLILKSELVAMQKLKKAEHELLMGVVFTASGIAITFLPLSMPANRLSYIIAWCAIIFGILKLTQGLFNKNRYKKILKRST